MVIGKKLLVDDCDPLVLNGVPLEFVSEYKYLGVTLCNGDSLTYSALQDGPFIEHWIPYYVVELNLTTKCYLNLSTQIVFQYLHLFRERIFFWKYAWLPRSIK